MDENAKKLAKSERNPRIKEQETKENGEPNRELNHGPRINPCDRFLDLKIGSMKSCWPNTIADFN